MSGRPKNGYATSLGEKVKGVTTIIGAQCHWGAKALQYWNWKEGYEGREWGESLRAAASAGSLAHQRIECFLKKTPFTLDPVYTPDQVEKAGRAFEAFEHWIKGQEIEPEAMEVALVSDRFRYAGTLDCVARVRGKASLLDWKTSNGVYSNYVVQVAAYRQLWNEANEDAGTDDEVLEDAYLFRMDKECAGWSQHYFPSEQLDIGWEAFLHFLELDRIEKQIKV